MSETDKTLKWVNEAFEHSRQLDHEYQKLLCKKYAGGAVFHLKDDTKLYDHADISDVEWNTDNERNLVMYGKDYIVPLSNVKYVQRIPDSTEDKQ